jgi:hypothetical protein
MNEKPTQAGLFAGFKMLEVKIEYIAETLRLFKEDFREHCRRQFQTWLWIVPTLFSIAQFLYMLLSHER